MEVTLSELRSIHYYDVASGGLTQELLTNQWVAKDRQNLFVTLLVDINFAVSVFHLRTSIYRLVHSYQHGHVKLANFHADLCYQLGGNKNIPQSIKIFSPSATSKLVALISLELPITEHFAQSNDISSIELTDPYERVYNTLFSLGRHLDDTQAFPDLSREAVGDERLQAISKFFKLSPVESRTGQVLEYNALMKVTMKEIV